MELSKRETKVKEHPMQHWQSTLMLVIFIIIFAIIGILFSSCGSAKSCQSMQGNMKPLTQYHK